MPSFKCIPIDPNIPYGQNLADAINKFWLAKVCTWHGNETSHTTTKTVMSTRNGIPFGVYRHPCIVQCKRVPGTNRWMIADADSEGRPSTSQSGSRIEDTRKALSRRAQIRRRIEESYGGTS